MDQIRIVVEHVPELPGGLPAIWTDDPSPGDGYRLVRLYLLADLPQDEADHFRAMVVRECLPDVEWEDFIVGNIKQPMLQAVSA